ncbi:MAG: hypothetical protein OYH77_04170 [Pseudomonadota bacterium]|nr:hypothetical protein [Pseudomonadota bacterium]
MAGCLTNATTWRRTIVAIATIVTANAASHAALALAEPDTDPKSVRQAVICQQVFFSDHQRQSLATDKPLRDLVLSQEHLYVLGKQHVWRFDLGKSALRKFTFAPSSSLQDAHLARDDKTGEVYLATPQMLFIMHSDAQDTTQSRPPQRGEPRVLKYFQQELTEVFDFRVTPANYTWITGKGIYLLERQSLQLRFLRYPLKPSDQVVIAPSLRSFYVLRGNKLLRINQKLQAKEILHADGLRIASDDQTLYVRRDKAILRFTFAGELLQTIPAVKRLAGMRFAADEHSYMFYDGMFEHYRLASSDVLVGKCASGSKIAANRSGLDVFAGRVAFIGAADNPYMYELRK